MRAGSAGFVVVLTGLVHAVSAQNPGGGACIPIIDHTELTQAVQEGHGPDPFLEPELFPPMQYPPVGGAPLPTIPLIDGRSTALRIYIKEPSGGANCDFNQDGKPDIGGHVLVEVPGPGGAMVPSVLAGGASNTAPSDLLPPWARDQESSTLNFRFLPTGANTSDRVINITSCVGLVQSGSQSGWGILPRHCIKQDVLFVYRRRPLFGGIPINHTFIERLPGGAVYPEPGTPSPPSIAPRNADQLLWAALPFPDDPGLGGGYKVYPELEFEWKYCARNDEFGEGNCGLTDPRPSGYREGELRALPLFAKLKEINCAGRFSGAARKADYVYGWFQKLSVSAGRADRGNGVAIGDSYSESNGITRAIYAHENGHLFGRPNRPSTASTGDIGWDVLARTWPDPFSAKRVRPNEFDLMAESTDADKWIRGDDFLAIMETSSVYERKICSRPADVTTTFVQNILPVIARAPQAPNDQAGFLSAIETVTEVDTTPLSTGDVVLQALDATEDALYSTWASRNDFDQVFMPIPANGNVNELRLLVNGVVRASVVRSASAPVVSFVSPASTSSLTETLTVSWQQSDADHDDLVSNVLYSPDNISWYPIGVRLTETSLTVSTAHLPSSSSGLLEIRTSDGLNTTAVQVTGLELGPNRSPSIQILSPNNGESIHYRDNIVFVAQSEDPEDGANWNSQALLWTSSIDGVFANGLSANFNALSPGNHLVSATTTDSIGASATDSISLVIQP